MTATFLIATRKFHKSSDNCFAIGSIDHVHQHLLPNSKHQKESAKVTSNDYTQIGTCFSWSTNNTFSTLYMIKEEKQPYSFIQLLNFMVKFCII